ncbi:MAG: dephospho-CoA kinase [Dehalococcoidales bacterium]|nr:dephospho-CoA kinase [Dehalococcoidales bacterium]
MKVIGLTGGIGTGKSTVGKFLAELGAEVFDLDKVGHEVLQKGSPAYEGLVRRFGREILGENGEIDRNRLSQFVFGDQKALEELNSIVHPVIDGIVIKRIEECRRRGVSVVVLEAAALIESRKTFLVDEIWVTTAPEDVVLRRLSERSGYSEAEARKRISAQLSQEERIRHADVVIDTNCSLEELKSRVRREWDKLLKRAG